MRLKVLDVFLAEEAFSDVIREAQELVELATKAMLRQIGVEPPKWHDVGRILVEKADRFSAEIGAQIPRIAEISRALRKEREFSFYGEEDFVPTEEYSRADADKAIEDARLVFTVAEKALGPP